MLSKQCIIDKIQLHLDEQLKFKEKHEVCLTTTEIPREHWKDIFDHFSSKGWWCSQYSTKPCAEEISAECK